MLINNADARRATAAEANDGEPGLLLPKRHPHQHPSAPGGERGFVSIELQEGMAASDSAPGPGPELSRVDSKLLKAEESGRKSRRAVSLKGIFLLLCSKVAGTGHIVTTRVLLKNALFEPAALAVLRNVVTILFLGALLGIKPDLRSNLKQIRGEVFTHWKAVTLGASGTFILQTFGKPGTTHEVPFPFAVDTARPGTARLLAPPSSLLLPSD